MQSECNMKKKTLIIIAIVVALVVCAAIFFRPVSLLNGGSVIESGTVLYVRYSDDLKQDEFESFDTAGYEQELTDYFKTVKVRRTLSSKYGNGQYMRLNMMLTCSGNQKGVNIMLWHDGSHANINGKYYDLLDPEKVFYDLLDILGIEDDFPFETITY